MQAVAKLSLVTLIIIIFYRGGMVLMDHYIRENILDSVRYKRLRNDGVLGKVGDENRR